jgi:hypothetical protein
LDFSSPAPPKHGRGDGHRRGEDMGAGSLPRVQEAAAVTSAGVVPYSDGQGAAGSGRTVPGFDRVVLLPRFHWARGGAGGPRRRRCLLPAPL